MRFSSTEFPELILDEEWGAVHGANKQIMRR